MKTESKKKLITNKLIGTNTTKTNAIQRKTEWFNWRYKFLYVHLVAVVEMNKKSQQLNHSLTIELMKNGEKKRRMKTNGTKAQNEKYIFNDKRIT